MKKNLRTLMAASMMMSAMGLSLPTATFESPMTPNKRYRHRKFPSRHIGHNQRKRRKAIRTTPQLLRSKKYKRA